MQLAGEKRAHLSASLSSPARISHSGHQGSRLSSRLHRPGLGFERVVESAPVSSHEGCSRTGDRDRAPWGWREPCEAGALWVQSSPEASPVKQSVYQERWWQLCCAQVLGRHM